MMQNKRTIFSSIIIFVSIFLLIFSTPTYATSQHLAEVGYLSQMGKVELYTERFLKEFPDGSEINALSTAELGGLVYVLRRGFRQTGDCYLQRVPLVDKFGEVLISGSNDDTEGPVFIISESLVEVLSCDDVGCADAVHSLKLTDTPYFEKAYCDVTNNPDKPCACRIEFSAGVATYENRDHELCKPIMGTNILKFYEWLFYDGGDYDPIPQ